MVNPLTPTVPSAPLRGGLAMAALAALLVPAAAGEAAFHDRKFQVADGFTLEVAAAPSLVERPIEACFDGKGRLLVTESSGSNAPVEQQLKEKPHRVLRLSDEDGDGVFDKKTVFADGLMFPEGILWHGGSVYVAAPPQIWKFTDGDDDGVAEQRGVWYDGKTLTGCANDLHGPYAGPDGLIYWCKGAFAAQTHDLPGKPGWTTRASHVFRAKPDGTGLECVFTAGMDNPVGVAWTPEGDLMVSGTFLQHPEAGRRDGILHAVRGGVWGKDHDVLDGHPRTGGLMPAMTHLGPAAAASMCRYGRDLLVCQFNLRTVSRHQLIPHGATYRTEDSPLLVSEHPDFHPTDVLQAPDGSIVVVDTGGWYKLCCPTSQLAKPDVPGAIYRLRRSSGEVPAASPPPQWTSGITETPEALHQSLKSPHPHLRRRAIEGLGQWPGRQVPPASRTAAAKRIVPLLLDAAQEVGTDRFLENAVTYALLEGGDPATMAEALPKTHAAGRRALLFALAQTDPAAVAPSVVAALLPAAGPGELEALLFSFARVPAWKTAATGWLRSHLAEQPGPVMAAMIDSLSTAAADMLPDPGGLLQGTRDPALRLKLIAAMRSMSRQSSWPGPWAEPLLDSLRSGPPAEAPAAAGFFSDCSLAQSPGVRRALTEFAGDTSRPAALRLAVLANPELSGAARDHLPLLLEHLAAGTPAELRLQTAKTISRLTLEDQQLLSLTAVIGKAGLLERPLLLRAYQTCGDEAVGQQLLDQLEAAGGLVSLPDQVLQECLAGFPGNVRERARAAKAAGRTGHAEQLRRLTELEKTLPPGDATRGSIHFLSAKAACVLCHAIGYKGGTLGPDLSRIGTVRTRRDLLEAVLYPSASFVRNYETVAVEQQDGTSHSGVIRNQSAEALTLATSAATPDITVRLEDIKSLTAGEVSLMPGAFDQILAKDELADLIAYLQSLK